MAGLLILLLLDPSQHLAKTLVLDDGRVADALQLVEGGVRQGQSLPADLQLAIGKVIDVDQLACHCRRTLGWDKAKLHQSAGGVINEHQKRAGRRPIFEPAMVRTVNSAPHPSDPQPPNLTTKREKTDIPTLLSADILALRLQDGFVEPMLWNIPACWKPRPGLNTTLYFRRSPSSG